MEQKGVQVELSVKLVTEVNVPLVMPINQTIIGVGAKSWEVSWKNSLSVEDILMVSEMNDLEKQVK